MSAVEAPNRCAYAPASSPYFGSEPVACETPAFSAPAMGVSGRKVSRVKCCQLRDTGDKLPLKDGAAAGGGADDVAGGGDGKLLTGSWPNAHTPSQNPVQITTPLRIIAS